MENINKMHEWFKENYELRESKTRLENPDPDEVGASLGLAGISIQYQLYDKNRSKLLEDTWPVGAGFNEIIEEIYEKYYEDHTGYTWDLSKIYEDDMAYEIDFKFLVAMTKQMEDIDRSKDNLLQILQLSESISRKLSTLYAYSHMKRDEDTTRTQSQTRLMEIETQAARVSSAMSFIEPLVLSLDKDEIEKILQDQDYERFYKQIEKILRFKDYTLSDKEEEILSILGPAIDTGQSTYYTLEHADMEYGQLEENGDTLTDANYVKYLQDPDRDIRKAAYKLMYETQSQYKNTIATTLYSNIRDKSQVAKLRGYSSLRHMELYRDDVPEELYDDLIEVIEEYLPHYQKFYELRSGILGLEEAFMYDVYTSITEDSIEYSYEEAKDIILKSLQPLGEEYLSIVKRAFDEDWIDVYPRDKKASGAYSFGTYDTDPYILMNYTGDLNSVFTLAHELGHSIHSYYSRNYNDYLESRYTIFVAEVASTFNENLLLDYMLKNAKTDEEILSILNHQLESFKGTVFRQAMFAEFERKIHSRVDNGEGLTHQDFGDIYHNLNEKYFGDSVISDALIRYEWMRIPHFYRNFYVYKYATGYIASTALSKMVLEGGEKELERYIDFLKDGSNHFPLEQLRSAGCDLLDKDTLRTALDIFKETVERLEQLIKE